MKDQLTPLKETGIYIVELPKGSKVLKTGIGDDDLPYAEYVYRYNYHYVRLPEGNWQILGTITKDLISFDPAPYLEKLTPTLHKQICYKDHMDVGKTYPIFNYFINPKNSFYSLLAANGYHWVNPLAPSKCEVGCCCNEEQKHGCLGDYVKWKSFNDNLVKGILLSLIKK